MRQEKIASWAAIVGNTILFIGKIIVGIMYNSIAIISDALNSFTDIIASAIVHVSLLVSYKKPDKDHQFGHDRAQPIAGLIVAIFTGIVGFEVIVASINRMISGGEVEKGAIPIILVVIVLFVKLGLYYYTKAVCRRTKSQALSASAVDHMNDVMISIAVLVGVTGANLGYNFLDPLVGILIGIFIIKSGFDIGKDNVRYLMGEAPSEDLFKKIEKEAKSIKGVIGINDIRAHYVGVVVEAEVHIYVDKKMTVLNAHDLGKQVQKKLENISEISRAFIHIDPFEGEFVKSRKF